MAQKKSPPVKPRSSAKPAAKGQLQNLAARPSYDEILDEQLVDHSGVFRVTAAISQAQAGHEDDAPPRFASDSLVMAAQRDGFRDDGPTIDEGIEERSVEDEAARAERRQRLATLAARAKARTRGRRS